MTRSIGTLRLTSGLAAVLLSLAACADQRTPITEPAQIVIENAVSLSARAEVGKAIFNDANLSINQNQSCASCHDPAYGWTGPNSIVNAAGSVYEGSIAGRFGDRKPPSSAYATFSPVLYHDRFGTIAGGNFWDGRATGWTLGSPSAEQAKGPFLNPAEQALPDAACLVYRVSVASYASLYISAVGPDITTIAFPSTTDSDCASGATIVLSATDRATVDREYDNIAYVIAAFEASAESNQFTSKFDAWKRGLTSLTKEEVKGWSLFQGKGRCAACHPARGEYPGFTDFTYDNLGVPRNPANPATLANPAFVDVGLGGFLAQMPWFADPAPQMGKHKVPTLRNVDLRPSPNEIKAYMHNGVFKSLEEVVHFYNTRDVLPACESLAAPVFGVNCWPAPEYALNVNRDELGNLGLSLDEELALVAFLRTLSDGYLMP